MSDPMRQDPCLKTLTSGLTCRQKAAPTFGTHATATVLGAMGKQFAELMASLHKLVWLSVDR
jgi:hypothetical protein